MKNFGEGFPGFDNSKENPALHKFEIPGRKRYHSDLKMAKECLD